MTEVRRAALGGLAASLLMWGAASGQEPAVESPIAPPPPAASEAPAPIRPKVQRPAAVQPPAPAPAPTEVAPLPAPVPSLAPPAPVQPASPEWLGMLQAAAPVALALFGLALTWVAILQLGLAGKLAGESRKNHALTKQSADAATALAGIAAETAHRQLRAYVHQSLLFFQPLTDPSEPDRRHSIQVETHWTNYGQTPARDVVTGGGWRAFDATTGVPDDFDFPDAPVADPPAPVTLGPSQMAQGIVTVPVDAMEQAQRGEAMVLVWSWVEYNDAFKGGVRRRTESAHRVVPSNNLHDETGRYFALRQTRFQGADDDCHHKPRTESRRGGQNA